MKSQVASSWWWWGRGNPFIQTQSAASVKRGAAALPSGVMRQRPPPHGRPSGGRMNVAGATPPLSIASHMLESQSFARVTDPQEVGVGVRCGRGTLPPKPYPPPSDKYPPPQSPPLAGSVLQPYSAKPTRRGCLTFRPKAPPPTRPVYHTESLTLVEVACGACCEPKWGRPPLLPSGARAGFAQIYSFWRNLIARPDLARWGVSNTPVAHPIPILWAVEGWDPPPRGSTLPMHHCPAPARPERHAQRPQTIGGQHLAAHNGSHRNFLP